MKKIIISASLLYGILILDQKSDSIKTSEIQSVTIQGTKNFRTPNSESGCPTSVKKP